MKQRIKNKLIKKAHIAPLISSYEKSIVEWQQAYKSAMDRDSKDELGLCKKMMWYNYSMMDKIRNKFSFKDITKYRYKKMKKCIKYEMKVFK